ncbi:MAG: hypothetical protein ACOCXX_03950 [Planctomycetota bacterium]
MAVPSLDRRMAVMFALIGFLSVVLMGVASGGQSYAIVKRGLIAGVVGFFVGRIVGFVTISLTREILPPPTVRTDEDTEQGVEGEPEEEP